MNLYGCLGAAVCPNATVSGGEWICQADGDLQASGSRLGADNRIHMGVIRSYRVV